MKAHRKQERRCSRLPISERRRIRSQMAIIDPQSLTRQLASGLLTCRKWPDGDGLWIAAIDGGISGQVVALDPQNRWRTQRVVVTRYKGRNVLDIQANLLLLQTMAKWAGGLDRIVVVYESSRKNTAWGIKNSFAGGRHDEFWRVLLSLSDFHLTSVDPKTWQAWCFEGMKPAKKPKQRARQFVQRKCPDLAWLDAYPQAEQAGIVDAMCIALWARHQQETRQLGV